MEKERWVHMKEKLNVLWKYIDRIAFWGMGHIEHLFGIEIQSKTKTTFIQFVKFGIVGVSNTLMSYMINVIVLLLLAPKNISWDYFVANIVSFLISVLWSFFWNYSFVFEKKENKNVWIMLLKTYISYGVTGLVLANVMSYVLVGIIGVSKYIAPLIVLLISVPVNYVLNKFWAFR